MEVLANVESCFSLDLGQTTHTTPDICVGRITAPVARGVSPGPRELNFMDFIIAGTDRISSGVACTVTPIASAPQQPQIIDPTKMEDLSLVPSLFSIAGRFPLSAVGSGVVLPHSNLVERSPSMYAVPVRERVECEQSESALVERGIVMSSGSRVTIRSEESDETLSPNQHGTFSYGMPSEPVGSDIEPLIREQAGQAVSSAVVCTARRVDPGPGAHPPSQPVAEGPMKGRRRYDYRADGKQ